MKKVRHTLKSSYHHTGRPVINFVLVLEHTPDFNRTLVYYAVEIEGVVWHRTQNASEGHRIYKEACEYSLPKLTHIITQGVTR